jgi:hypothetical protein
MKKTEPLEVVKTVADISTVPPALLGDVRLNLIQKMIKIREAVPYLQKTTDGFQYKYTSSSQVLGSVIHKMNELGILLIPEIKEQKVTPYTSIAPGFGGKPDKTKVLYFTELDMEFLWINADDKNDFIKVCWAGQGTDDFEKGIGKALTYAEKYLILKTFNIPTDKDDPDAFQEKIDKAEKVKLPEPTPFDEPKNKKEDFIAMIKLMHENDKALCATYLESVTGRKASKDLTQQDIDKHIGTIEADFQIWTDDQISLKNNREL